MLSGDLGLRRIVAARELTLRILVMEHGA
jgi:hypothetical protein